MRAKARGSNGLCGRKSMASALDADRLARQHHVARREVPSRREEVICGVVLWSRAVYRIGRMDLGCPSGVTSASIGSPGLKGAPGRPFIKVSSSSCNSMRCPFESFMMSFLFSCTTTSPLYTEERGVFFSRSSIAPKETVGAAGIILLLMSKKTVAATIRAFIDDPSS